MITSVLTKTDELSVSTGQLVIGEAIEIKNGTIILKLVGGYLVRHADGETYLRDKVAPPLSGSRFHGNLSIPF